MTTSSRKKGILPVRLGLEPDNKTALRELGMDESLADTMSDRQLDELIINNEAERIKSYYSSKELDGTKQAEGYKQQAMKNINND